MGCCCCCKRGKRLRSTAAFVEQEILNTSAAIEAYASKHMKMLQCVTKVTVMMFVVPVVVAAAVGAVLYAHKEHWLTTFLPVDGPRKPIQFIALSGLAALSVLYVTKRLLVILANCSEKRRLEAIAAHETAIANINELRWADAYPLMLRYHPTGAQNIEMPDEMKRRDAEWQQQLSSILGATDALLGAIRSLDLQNESGAAIKPLLSSFDPFQAQLANLDGAKRACTERLDTRITKLLNATPTTKHSVSAIPHSGAPTIANNRHAAQMELMEDLPELPEVATPASPHKDDEGHDTDD